MEPAADMPPGLPPSKSLRGIRGRWAGPGDLPEDEVALVGAPLPLPLPRREDGRAASEADEALPFLREGDEMMGMLLALFVLARFFLDKEGEMAAATATTLFLFNLGEAAKDMNLLIIWALRHRDGEGESPSSREPSSDGSWADSGGRAGRGIQSARGSSLLPGTWSSLLETAGAPTSRAPVFLTLTGLLSEEEGGA